MSAWRKSSRCNGGACIEVGSWRTSTRCASNECVEAGHAPGIVGVRDSAMERDQPGSSPVLEFPAEAWRAFTAALKAR